MMRLHAGKYDGLNGEEGMNGYTAYNCINSYVVGVIQVCLCR